MKFFKIQPMDRIEAMRLIGDSIPAVATATAVAAGLACLHFIRLFRFREALASSRSLAFQEQENLRNIFFKSSVSLETLQPMVFDAESPAKNQLGLLQWSMWDAWQLPGRPRLGALWDFLKGKGVDTRKLSDVRGCAS
jgi:hypothetical protein